MTPSDIKKSATLTGLLLGALASTAVVIGLAWGSGWSFVQTWDFMYAAFASDYWTSAMFAVVIQYGQNVVLGVRKAFKNEYVEPLGFPTLRFRAGDGLLALYCVLAFINMTTNIGEWQSKVTPGVYGTINPLSIFMYALLVISVFFEEVFMRAFGFMALAWRELMDALNEEKKHQNQAPSRDKSNRPNEPSSHRPNGQRPNGHRPDSHKPNGSKDPIANLREQIPQELRSDFDFIVARVPNDKKLPTAGAYIGLMRLLAKVAKSCDEGHITESDVNTILLVANSAKDNPGNISTLLAKCHQIYQDALSREEDETEDEDSEEAEEASA